MKIFQMITVLMILFASVHPAWAMSADFENSLPEEVQEIVEEAGEDNLSWLTRGGEMLWEKCRESFAAVLRESLGGAVLLLCAVILCALADDCCKAAGEKGAIDLVPITGAVVITMIAAGDIRTLMGQGLEAIESLHLFSQVLLPTLMAAVAASGGAVSAGVRHVAAVFFTDILISLIRDFLVPMVYAYIAVAAADAMLPRRQLRNVAKAIRKGTVWLLSGLLVLYTGYLALAGATASSADTLAVQLTRSAMGVVPVVGGILSDAAGTVLHGASVLKNTVGIAGTLAVLAVCLVPFLKLAVQYLLYKMTAFLAGTLGTEGLVSLIDDLGSAFGLILGMTGACAMLLLISAVSSVMVVTV